MLQSVVKTHQPVILHTSTFAAIAPRIEHPLHGNAKIETGDRQRRKNMTIDVKRKIISFRQDCSLPKKKVGRPPRPKPQPVQTRLLLPRLSSEAPNIANVAPTNSAMPSFTSADAMNNNLSKVKFSIEKDNQPNETDLCHAQADYIDHIIHDYEGKITHRITPDDIEKKSFGVELSDRKYLSLINTAHSSLKTKRLRKPRTLTVREQLAALSCGIELDEPMQESSGSSAVSANNFTNTGDSEVILSSLLNIRSDPPKAYLCQVCGAMLQGRSSLRTHILSHSETDKKFQCNLCPAAFKWKQSLDRHKFSHTGETPFACRVCPAAFTTRANCSRHELLHQEASAQCFPCDLCSKVFKSKCTLQRHRASHDDAPAVCLTCDRTFKSKSSLAVHRMSHNRSTEMHKCKICDKEYLCKNSLKRHMEGHDGTEKHQCTICSLKFVWKSGLVSHLQTHLPKKYSCEICHVGFNVNSKLLSHMKKHTNPKPFSCKYCLKRFPFNYLLVRHIKSFHNLTEFSSSKKIENYKFADVSNNLLTKDFQEPALPQEPAYDIMASYDRECKDASAVSKDHSIGNELYNQQLQSLPVIKNALMNVAQSPCSAVGSISVREVDTECFLSPVTTEHISERYTARRGPPPSYECSPCNAPTATNSPYFRFEGASPGTFDHAMCDSPSGYSEMLCAEQDSQSAHPSLLHATDPYLHTSSGQSLLHSPHSTHCSPAQPPPPSYEFPFSEADASPPTYHTALALSSVHS